MKFYSLKEFWEWLTISTGDLVQDYKSVVEYSDSEDVKFLNWEQIEVLYKYRYILRQLFREITII